MENQELVSVIIPVCNQKQTIKRCIDSILSQTYRNFEIIIIDDCSTDGTMEYIDLYYGDITDINIIYIRNDAKLGFSASENTAISCANGEYIAFHSADAWWSCDKLEKQMKVMAKADESVGAVYGVTEYKRNWGSELLPPETVGMSEKSGDIYFSLLLKPFVALETLLLRKEVLFDIGGFDEQLHALEDYDLTIRIAEAWHISFLDEILAEKEEVAHTPESESEETVKNRIDAHFYFMKQYREDLEKFDMKRRKIESVYEEAETYGKRYLFFQCVAPLLDDEEYISCVQKKIELLNPSSHPEQIKTQDISGVSACTGCMACLNGCPVDAIRMECDKEGFLVPVIDTGRCIQCGKCKEICPVCNEISERGVLLPDDCYAVMGSKEIRKKSSSGGVFSILAEKILEEGGYVAGAVWNEDWQVVHIVSNDRKDMERMRSSKYVQSNIGVTYREIKVLLDKGEKVLFTGCPCQVAGLKRYLGHDYDNLLLVEIVCHGVPSQETFNSYIRDFSQVEQISFRDKAVFGWNTGLYVKYKDGTEYRNGKRDSYMFGFLSNWILRKSCYDCKFKNKKYSDIMLGDFWGIGQIPDFDDGMGTSLVTLNTKKGVRFLESVREQFEKITCLRTNQVKPYNMCICESVSMPKNRELFFAQWQNGQDTIAAIEAVKKQIHFDIALVVWWSTNYGNALTNYALYCYLQKQGKSVVILDNYGVRPKERFRDFAERYYDLSSQYFPDFHYDMLNQSCGAFVVGSDQCWNYNLYEDDWNYFYLDFIAENRKKVSYSASFGVPEGAMPAEKGKYVFGRFHAISVREDFGVELCDKLYGIRAQRVLDPVFLLDKKDYDELIGKVRNVETEPYIAVYLLNPTAEKRKLCLEVQKNLGGIRLLNIIDASQGGADLNRKILEYDNIKSDLTVKEWLNYIRCSRFVITDSFHGTCFAMIFEKNFISFRARESARFDTFWRFSGIGQRVLEGETGYDLDELLSDVDYGQVRQQLEQEKRESEAFIREYILS